MNLDVEINVEELIASLDNDVTLGLTPAEYEASAVSPADAICVGDVDYEAEIAWDLQVKLVTSSPRQSNLM